MTINWEKENKPYKVGDNWRKSPLSHKPGGVTVYVKYTNGFVKEYDKIKYPKRFMDKIHESNNPNIINIWMEN